MNMQAEHGLKLIHKAIENHNKDKLYTQWLHDPSRFEVPFNEYYARSKPYRKSTNEEKEDILKKYGGG